MNKDWVNKIESLKAVPVKNDKTFYYRKFDDNTDWFRISKLGYENITSKARSVALEISYESDQVVFLRYCPADLRAKKSLKSNLEHLVCVYCHSGKAIKRPRRLMDLFKKPAYTYECENCLKKW